MISLTGQASAHELRPAVAEISIDEEKIQISLRLAVETLLAGIDQSQVADTDEAPEAEAYDRLRGLPDQALAQMVETRFADISGGISLEGAGPLSLTSVDVIAEPDLELPRDSVVTMSAELPPGTAPVSLGWPREMAGWWCAMGRVQTPMRPVCRAARSALPCPGRALLTKARALCSFDLWWKASSISFQRA